MLESKDLRLGNWIKLNDETEAEVKIIAITETTVSFKSKSLLGQMEISKFAGIPITEEWLVRMGAIKVNHMNGYSFWSFSKSKTNKMHLDWYENKTLWMGHSIRHCKFIHELQIVTPWLTGEELKIER